MRRVPCLQRGFDPVRLALPQLLQARFLARAVGEPLERRLADEIGQRRDHDDAAVGRHRRRTASGTLRELPSTARAPEWLNMTGAFATSSASAIVSSLT